MENGHEIISTIILPILLIQKGQFSVTGAKYVYKLPSMAQLDGCPTGDQEVAGSTPTWSATFFHGDWYRNIFYGHSLPSADSRRTVVSFWRISAILVNYWPWPLSWKSVLHFFSSAKRWIYVVIRWAIQGHLGPLVWEIYERYFKLLSTEILPSMHSFNA